jgi:hypothetical protein
MQPDTQTGIFHIYKSERSGNNYLPAAALLFTDESTEDVDPAVAADESYLIYSSNRPQLREPKRLKIAFHTKGWSPRLDLGDAINERGSNIEARLSPDTTLFTSARILCRPSGSRVDKKMPTTTYPICRCGRTDARISGA